MASGFFVLLDDIATLMNDVATMGKIAGKKTAGILGDDLAVNAEKSSGFVSEREVPVLWAITKGSFLNKLIILPIAFLLSYFLPQSIVIILIIGGLYLSYEAVEKVLEYIFPHHHKENQLSKKELSREEVLAVEKEKIKSAILTDFILSVEIIIIALGAVVGEAIFVQVIVVTIIAIVATIGVYGIVAMIVRMDDVGYHMIVQGQRNSQPARKKVGTLMVRSMPMVIKAIGIIGTVALVLVSGGIFMHNIQFIHDILHSWPSLLAEVVTGIVVGFLVLAIVQLVKFIIKKIRN